jgi:protein phosphatase
VQLNIPELSLIVLIGASGSGKSTFAREHFLPTEVVSSDWARGAVSDDENDQSATTDAFALVHYLVAKRLERGRLTVVDATNVQAEARKPLLELARRYHVMPVAVVLNIKEELCQARNEGRPERQFGPHVVRRQVSNLRRSLRGLEREGFRYVHVLNSPEQVEAASVIRDRMWTDRREEHGPFDIIGDVHGCFDEVIGLLHELGYSLTHATDPDGRPTFDALHADGRRAIFLGDLVDRGPASPSVLRLVMRMVEAGTALCVPGNHENKLIRKLKGRDVQLTHGIAETLSQLEQEPEGFSQRALTFLDALVSHFVLDGGKLVVAHAGLPADMQGRASGRVRDFALYGETTGETDEFGLPVRYNWARDYRGAASVVYGHTPVREPDWENNTICLDTGCVFGGRLTALRYPERELVSVPAARVYYEPVKPFPTNADATIPAIPREDILDLADVTGTRIVKTALQGDIRIGEGQSAAALEVMSRWAIDPRWLIHLPPTMSPTETSQEPGLLEHPAEAFAYYRSAGVDAVVCEEKHMGSRAIVVLCRDDAVATSRFRISDGSRGIIYTRTGRRFFEDAAVESAILERLATAITAGGLWDELETDWLCLDAELLPWSAKAEPLIRQQYASVAAASRAGLSGTVAALEQAHARGAAVDHLLDRSRARLDASMRFAEAYRRYAWRVSGIEGLQIAPFHLLAAEGQVFATRDHRWHLEGLARLADADPALVRPTPHRFVHTTDPESEAAAVAWWHEVTAAGSEGMVVKPLSFIAKGRRGVLQPALKVRGAEYLRIIYGPEYTLPHHLERLRQRGVGAKRALALREFALGIEALERFVRHEPLYRVHECVFGVLALESEPVDPRL